METDPSVMKSSHGSSSTTRPCRVLLVTPPLVQPNTPYAATPLLAGYLRGRGIAVAQADASLELVLRLFSRAGLAKVEHAVSAACRTSRGLRRRPSVSFFLAHAERYGRTVGPVVRFLQGRNPGLCDALARRKVCPEGPRFDLLGQGAGRHWALISDALDGQERARYIASLFLDDVADVIREAVDGEFAFAKYGEKIAASLPSFIPLQAALDAPRTLVTEEMDRVTAALLKRYRPSVVGFTVPFPGTLFGALRMAREIKRRSPDTVVVLGGGYVSTELRGLNEPALFEFVDYVILDEGPAPFVRLLAHMDGRVPNSRLMRTFCRENGHVVLHDAPGRDVSHGRTGLPTWDGLPLDRYLSIMEMPNPAYRLWSDGRWNKIMLAQGCYWHRCRFCDTSLPYIRRYDPALVSVLVRRMKSAIAETGQSGFHFVDEAIPPALAARLSEALHKRGVNATWWGNIRFEPAFSNERIRLMREAGCVAVTGGLETVCDRTLGVMNKGIRLSSGIATIARFAEAGVLVHVYLMYGFPGQTVGETVDALEIVRQLFAAGWVESAYWHRFALSVHSEMAADPAAFGITAGAMDQGGFARNEVPVMSGVDAKVVAMGPGLHKAVYNFMHGLGLEEDVRAWFGMRVPRPNVTSSSTRRRLQDLP